MKQLPLFAVPTVKQWRAIAVLQAHPGLEPTAFAKLMWPRTKGNPQAARFYWSMERVALGMLRRLSRDGYAFVLGDGKWYAAVNIARVTLEPDESTPF